jgi:hypothetical protein
MPRKPNKAKALQIVRIHFTVPKKEKRVLLPDQFVAENYPKRTQSGLKTLKKLGYNLQISIQ